ADPTRSIDIHDDVRETRTRASDSGRLHAEQPDEHIDRRVFVASAPRSDRVPPNRLDGVDGHTRSRVVHGRNRAAANRAAAQGSLAGLLHAETAPVLERDPGAQRPELTARPDKSLTPAA